MNAIKEQLCLRYPFLRKTGTVHTSFDVKEIVAKERSEKLLVIMVGVQGSGKTTYCKEHFSEYPVINLDDIMINYLNANKKASLEEANRNVNRVFFNRIEKSLKRKRIVVIDAGAVHINVRVLMLEKLQNMFTKAILIVLNPAEEQIIRQVKGQLNLRARPGLWSDISSEYELLQHQIQNHVLEMGVDEVYML